MFSFGQAEYSRRASSADVGALSCFRLGRRQPRPWRTLSLTDTPQHAPDAAIRPDLLLLSGCAGNILAQHLGVLIELLRCALLKRKLPGRVVFPSQPLVGCGEREVYGRILGRKLGGSFERFHSVPGFAGIQQRPAQAEVRLAE